MKEEQKSVIYNECLTFIHHIHLIAESCCLIEEDSNKKTRYLAFFFCTLSCCCLSELIDKRETSFFSVSYKQNLIRKRIQRRKGKKKKSMSGRSLEIKIENTIVLVQLFFFSRNQHWIIYKE